MPIKRIDIVKKNFFYTSCLVVLLMLVNPFIIYSISSVQQKSEEMVILRITSTPTPNMIPIFVILDQGLLAIDGIDLEYVPSKDIRDVMVHLMKEDVDLGSFSVPSGVDMFHKGLRNIKFVGVHIWKAIYVVASKNISGWEAIKGESGLPLIIRTPS